MTQDKPSSAPAPSPLPSESSSPPAYRITLPEFEGPLDLLLHLCQTHELDILNISVSFIAQKYIEYLEVMENMAVEVAADYLVMAAHLAYLKSRELVPAPEPLEASEDGEEPLDPREELIRRLLEYQKYKNAAENLGSRPIEGRNVFVRGAVLQAEGEAGLAEHSVWKLIEHWAATLKKAKPEYTHNVVVDRLSISDRINQIVDLLEAGKGMVRFEDLLGQDVPVAELRHKVVVSLLAVLELAKLHVIRILQQEATGTFFLAQVEGAALDDARRLMVTSAKQEPKKEAESEAAAQPQSPAPQQEAAPAAPVVPRSPAAVEGNAEDAEDIEEAAGPLDAEFAALDAELAEIDAELARVDRKPSSSSAAELAPEEEAAPVEEAASVEETAPVEEQLTTEESAPVEQSAPAEEPLATEESGTVEQSDLPVEEPFAAEESAPIEATATPVEDVPVTDEPASPVENAAPIEESAPPVEKNAPVEDTAPVDSALASVDDRGDAPSDGAREAFELRPQEEVISAPSPASAATGEEATDGQTQEEQTPREE
jgi:segregation and condensation protein A